MSFHSNVNLVLPPVTSITIILAHLSQNGYGYISVVCVVTTVVVAVAAAVDGQSSTFIDFLFTSYEKPTILGLGLTIRRDFH